MELQPENSMAQSALRMANHNRTVLEQQQLGQLPLITMSLAVVTALSAMRDLIIWSEVESNWMLELNSIAVATNVLIAILAQIDRIPARLANIVTALSLLLIASKPIATLPIDLAPAPLYIATVLLGAAIALHSLKWVIVVNCIATVGYVTTAAIFLTPLQTAVTASVLFATLLISFFIVNRRIEDVLYKYRLTERIKELEAILPMCSSCKKTRNDAGEWLSIESYIEQQGGPQVSHSVCPECKNSLYGDLLKGR